MRENNTSAWSFAEITDSEGYTSNQSSENSQIGKSSRCFEAPTAATLASPITIARFED